jgi:hypothetical protein
MNLHRNSNTLKENEPLGSPNHCLTQTPCELKQKGHSTVIKASGQTWGPDVCYFLNSISKNLASIVNDMNRIYLVTFDDISNKKQKNTPKNILVFSLM